MGIREAALGFIGDVAESVAYRIGDIAKASGNSSSLTRNVQGGSLVPEPAKEEPKSIYWDPYSLVGNLGYKDKPTAITYGTLNHVLQRLPILRVIIKARVDQVASFCTVTHDKFGIGYRIRLRETERSPTKVELKAIDGLEEFIKHTGATNNPRGRDDFEKFVRKLMFDSLKFDQMCFETVPNRKGLPAEFMAVDASTIRLADTSKVAFNEADLDEVRYVQVYDNLVVNEYIQSEMFFGVRNPNSNILTYGYGESELEMLIRAITSMISAWDFNSNAFTQGSVQKGLLNFKGTMNENQMRNVRRQWYSQLSGVENAWRTPIVNSEGVEWINLMQSNRDMEYSAWMDFLIKVGCGMYSMDPSEINFKYGNTGQKSAMSEESNKEKVLESKERGLHPLLRFLQKAINKAIISPINPDLEFGFVGLDTASPDELSSRMQKQVQSIMYVDEARAELDKPPLPNGRGQCILNATWLQYNQGLEQKEQQEQQASGQDSPVGKPVDEDQAGEDAISKLFEQSSLEDKQGEGIEKSIRHYAFEV